MTIRIIQIRIDVIVAGPWDQIWLQLFFFIVGINEGWIVTVLEYIKAEEV